MDNAVAAAAVILAAMATYAGFAYVSRKSADPERERAQLAETERRITQIEHDEGIS